MHLLNIFLLNLIICLVSTQYISQHMRIKYSKFLVHILITYQKSKISVNVFFQIMTNNNMSVLE